MSVERTRAIVLRRTNYGEADRILKLLTPLGQRSVMAKGVRREKSKLAGGIELFAISDVVINSGKGDLGILTSAQLIHFYGHILEDYDRLQFGYEAVNLITKASEHIDEPEWYGVLSEIYMGLDVESIPLSLTQAWFYIHYAELTGYELDLEHDVVGKPLEADKMYMYDASERGFRPAEQGEVGAEHIKLLRLMATRPIKTIAQISGVEQVLSECWLVARQHAAI